MIFVGGGFWIWITSIVSLIRASSEGVTKGVIEGVNNKELVIKPAR